MSSGPRLYGMADNDNRQTPAPEGFRGERAAIVDDPALRHEVTVGDGAVAVQEDSGIAFVEASGAPGPAQAQPPAGDDPAGSGEPAS